MLAALFVMHRSILPWNVLFRPRLRAAGGRSVTGQSASSFSTLYPLVARACLLNSGDILFSDCPPPSLRRTVTPPFIDSEGQGHTHPHLPPGGGSSSHGDAMAHVHAHKQARHASYCGTKICLLTTSAEQKNFSCANQILRKHRCRQSLLNEGIEMRVLGNMLSAGCTWFNKCVGAPFICLLNREIRLRPALKSSSVSRP